MNARKGWPMPVRHDKRTLWEKLLDWAAPRCFVGIDGDVWVKCRHLRDGSLEIIERGNKVKRSA